MAFNKIHHLQEVNSTALSISIKGRYTGGKGRGGVKEEGEARREELF